MQTFLPYPSFRECARVLDDARLNAQIKEARQILDVLARKRRHGDRYEDGRPVGWANHPAVLMWEGCEWALILYHNEMLKERRGRPTTRSETRTLIGQVGFDVARPRWLGDERLHGSHRAALLAKDPEWYGRFEWNENPEVAYWWPTKEERRET